MIYESSVFLPSLTFKIFVTIFFDFFMEKHLIFYQGLLTNRKYSFKQIACQLYIKTVAFCTIDFIDCIDVRLQWYCNSLCEDFLPLMINLLLELCVKSLQQLMEAILILLASC